MVADNSLIKAHTWDTDDCREIIERLVTGTAPRFGALHEKIGKRREHYHNDAKANPKLPPPYSGKSEYQTDALRRSHIKHRARITENAPVVRVTPPRSTEKMRGLADDYASVRNRIYDIVQERTGQNFQSLLSDGQDRDCYGILHWVKATDLYPKFPDAELLGQLPEDTGEAKRFEPTPNDDGQYVETDVSRQERDRHAKARAGVPWHIEVIDPQMCGFVEDVGVAAGFAVFVVVREVGFLDYRDGLRKENATISLNQADKRVQVFTEADRPRDNSLSDVASSWGGKLKVAEVWNRTEWYELVSADVSGEANKFEMVKSASHPYEMPPFAIAYGHRNQHPDPVMAYEPVMEGLYRIKPSYDYVMALNEIIAQSIALPVWWIERADGTPQLNDRGKPIVLSRDTVSAAELPAGAKLVKAETELNPAFISLIELRQQELKDAAPDVGVSEVSATTQAWSILLQQQQASIEPKQIVIEQERALRTMHRNMALVESKNADEGGFGYPIWVYAKTQDGKVDSSTAIGIDPADIPTLEVDVEINPRSAAEVITRTEHGLNLLEKRVITLPDFKRDYQGVQKPEEETRDNIAWWAFVDYVQPGLIKQELAKKYSNYITIGPNGQFVGFDGMERSPQQVLQANGVMPSPIGPGSAPAGPAMPQSTPQGGAVGPPSLGAAPPPLPQMNVPTAVPQPGIPAGVA